ncbi:serine hydrolase [Solibacillus sp.]|uniref:serine hydrolase n=1 Tax=Solibacillus sp. TaxID=1909654 RepID=UPI0033150A50
MNTWAWISLLCLIFFTILLLLLKKDRTREDIRKAIVTVSCIICIIIAVSIFHVNYVFALFVGFLATILLDPKTYIKKRLALYGSLVLIISIAAYALYRDNPDYVIKHLKENPQSSSLYLSENGEPIITYQSDVIRPLASTVKIIIALEYAMQVEENIVKKDQTVSLDELKRFYLKNSDGGGHEAWLNTMESDGKIQNNEVSLHDVAKGMITYSSNANTDYLIHLLGMESINNRIDQLDLQQHEEVYPIVSALFISEHIPQTGMDEKELVNELNEMPIADYRSIAINLSEQMRTGELNLHDTTLDLSPALQRVWSDRLIGASANDYGKLLAIIANDKLPNVAANTLRDIMEWPMQLNEDNHKRFTHIGSKGGSTLFVLNNAMYAENLNGDQYEIVYLTDELNFIKRLLLTNNRKSFESKLLNQKDYRLKVQKELSE